MTETPGHTADGTAFDAAERALGNDARHSEAASDAGSARIVHPFTTVL